MADGEATPIADVHQHFRKLERNDEPWPVAQGHSELDGAAVVTLLPEPEGPEA